jgi:hypothetical protein
MPLCPKYFPFHNTVHASLSIVNFWVPAACSENFQGETHGALSSVVPALIYPFLPVAQYLKIGYYHFLLRVPFANFMDSPFYSESELFGGAVTASFSKYLPWQAMHFLQHSTHFSKMCCRPLITSIFLASELPFHGWKSAEIAWGEI